MQVLSLLVNHKCPYFWLSWFTRPLFLPLDLIFYFILLRRVGSLNLFVPSDPIRLKRMSPNTSEKTKGTKKSILASCLRRVAPFTHSGRMKRSAEKIKVYTGTMFNFLRKWAPEWTSINWVNIRFHLGKTPFGKKVGHIHR
jgi:hypothetical protein